MGERVKMTQSVLLVSKTGHCIQLFLRFYSMRVYGKFFLVLEQPTFNRRLLRLFRRTLTVAINEIKIKSYSQ
jgi:hypothetical protein